jgi:ABC-type multidrug transport system fused ATPase/permease subunit
MGGIPSPCKGSIPPQEGVYMLVVQVTIKTPTLATINVFEPGAKRDSLCVSPSLCVCSSGYHTKGLNKISVAGGNGGGDGDSGFQARPRSAYGGHRRHRWGAHHHHGHHHYHRQQQQHSLFIVTTIVIIVLVVVIIIIMITIMIMIIIIIIITILGLSSMSVPLPKPSAELRESMAKLASQYTEKAKQNIRYGPMR